MRHITCLILAPCALSACVSWPYRMAGTQDMNAHAPAAVDTATGTSLLSCPHGLVYIPVPPVPVSNYSELERVAGSDKWTSKTHAWPRQPDTGRIDNAKIHQLLPNISSNIADHRMSGAGDFSLFSLTGSKRSYVFDFTKWRGDHLEFASHPGQTAALVRVGAGLRVTVRLSARSGWAGGSLMGLAASLRTERIDGSIETELIGIEAPDITMAFPFTTDLSESNIQRILETLGVLKAKLYNEATAISPYLLAKIECARDPQSTPQPPRY